MIKSVLITGANGGLGKECARQLALQNGIEKIYLGCRNEEKAKAAKQDLEVSTGKSLVWKNAQVGSRCQAICRRFNGRILSF